MDRAEQRAWMAQWRTAAIALADQRASELVALRESEALAAAEALLSRLVRQQELFHRVRA